MKSKEYHKILLVSSYFSMHLCASLHGNVVYAKDTASLGYIVHLTVAENLS